MLATAPVQIWLTLGLPADQATAPVAYLQESLQLIPTPAPAPVPSVAFPWNYPRPEPTSATTPGLGEACSLGPPAAHTCSGCSWPA